MTAGLRVAFDHRIFVYQKHGGISRYFCGIAEHLDDFGIEPRVIAPLYVTDRLRALPARKRWGRHVAPQPRLQRAAQLLGEMAHAPLAARWGARVVHETYFNARRAAPRNAAIVVTVYDMIHELFPDWFVGDTTRDTKRASLARADRILCISESTRRDLLRFYPEVEDRTSVVLLGFDPVFAADAGDAPPSGERPYLLFVGDRRRYKNFAGLLEAFAQTALPRRGVELVCVGGGSFRAEEQERIAALGVADRVRQTDADDDELRRLYRGAELFVCPSLYEGFGIPPLEAMAAGCPTVVMNASSLPEVCGEAAEYADPGSIASLAAALEAVACSPARQDAMRAAGLAQARRFSWRRCAEETAAVYRDMA